MTEKDDGGPAFPYAVTGARGMSLRDWFAGQALSSFAASPSWEDISALDHGKAAYRLADAMLKARKGE